MQLRKFILFLRVMQILCDILLQMGMADLFTRTIQYAQKETETPLQTGPKMNEEEKYCAQNLHKPRKTHTFATANRA